MKKIILKNLLIGFGLVVVFNLVLFVISLVFGFESGDKGPTLLPAVIFAVAMAAIAWGLLKWLNPKNRKEAWGYSLSWAVIVFSVILFITIPNGTTKIFFGEWFNWLSFAAIAIAPIIPFKDKEKE